MPYLHFPSVDVLSLVLLSQAVPGSVQVNPCKAYRLPTGELVVELSQRLAKSVPLALEQFGVHVIKPSKKTLAEMPEPLEACCWQQLIPLQKCKTDDSSEIKTVLFVTKSGERFTGLASEMIRLGHDRISYRHADAESPGGLFGKREQAETSIFVRVIEPPYYTLVDVLDRSSPPDANEVRAYREQAPRVWVRMGFEHPQAARIDPPAGHFLLIDPPHEFEFVQEAPFEDIYQALDLRMPSPTQALQPVKVSTSLRVPLALTSAASSNSAEMWVIRKDAMQQLEQLVVRSDDELLDRLAFAVVSNEAEPVVVVRVRPSRAAVPILILDATAYATYLRLPNLFVPVGMRLQPPLRRDAIAKLLASDNRLISWLEVAEPRDAARRFWPFQTQTIADAAFRPLRDWVEYVLDHHAQALDTWTAAHRFEFDAFVCKDDIREPTRPTPDGQRSKLPKSTANPGSASQAGTKKDEDAATGAKSAEQITPFSQEAEPKPVSTNETIELLKQAEAAFLKSTAPLDAPERAEMWQRLGWLNSQLKHRLDATICWSNLLWYEGQLTGYFADQWLQAELRSSRTSRLDIQAVGRLISSRDSRGKDASLVAAYVVRAALDASGRQELQTIATDLTLYFEQHESQLPVRAVWLTALAMQQVVGGDPLGLARIRDRLLNRLYEHGLAGEFDIVSFLRGSGQNQSDQHRVLRMRWSELHDTVNKWLSDPIMNRNQTGSYVRFMFAYCLVRIGEVANGRELLGQATTAIKSRDPIHSWMSKAFSYRVEQAAQGGNNREPLPEKLLRKLETMDRLDRYKIDRMRQHSRVLEPHIRIDPYRRWHRRYSDELFQTLAELKDLLDLKKVEAKLRELSTEHTQGTRGLRVLASALEYAPRLGDQFATQLLDRVDTLLADCTDVVEKSLLIHRALYVAGHFGHTARVNALVVRLRNELPAIVEYYLKLVNQLKTGDDNPIETVENLLQHSFRGLRKLGLREELSALYGRIGELVEMHHQRAQQSSAQGQTGSDASLARRLSLWLCVASGYYFFGNSDEANRTADKVRQVLLDGTLVSIEQRRLASAYVACVSLGNADVALQRIFELFKCTSDGKRILPRIEDTMTTSSHFSVSELELVEASLLSMLSEESSWDPQCQLWLDQDEFAIRKKIHADMHSALHG